MKDSLHFIVFGVLALLGVVMMSVGVISKTGAQSRLEATAKQVDAAVKSNPPTKGDVSSAKGKQDAFNASIGGFENKLRNEEGLELVTFSKTYSADDFYTDRASKDIPDLKDRFARLKTRPAVPTKLVAIGAELQPEEDEAENFWTTTTNEMSNRSKQPLEIERMQAQLKIMRDVCVVCERLLAGEFKGLMFSFRKFEFGAFNQEAQPDSKDPWLRHEFTFCFDADPSLAVAIVDALLCPTEANAGSGDAARPAIPYDLVSLAGTQIGRPLTANYRIDAAERKTWNIPDDWEEEKDQHMDENKPNHKRKEVADGMEKQTVFSQPLRYDAKLQAMRINKDWKAIKAAEAAPAEGG